MSKKEKRFVCNVGDKFGDWEVIDNTPIIKSRHTHVLARCKCGKEEVKCLSDLMNGRTLSCRSCAARKRSRDIKIGDKYKHWVVISGPRVTKNHCIEWLVECDCGRNRRWIQGNGLTDISKSFECSQCAAEKRGKLQSMSNGRVGDLSLTRFTRIKRSAKVRGIEFNLTIEYLWNLFISQKQICSITGDFIQSIENASLDRIDSSKGYVPGNVQWVTCQANLSKHTMSMDELYTFCRKVLNHSNQQPVNNSGSETNILKILFKKVYDIVQSFFKKKVK